MKKRINLIFLSTLIIYSIYCAASIGEGWDVSFHYNIGKDRLDYLFSFGANEVNKNPFVSKFYTGAYSTLSAFFVQFFPMKYNIEVMYIFNFCFSMLTIFGIYRFAKEFFNKKIAKITFLLCFFNPIFFGHMAMNSNDTIVAFSNIWLIYISFKYLKYQNRKIKKNNYIVYLGLLLGLGLGVRYTFLITLVPLLLLLFLEIMYFKILINKNFSKKIFFYDAVKVAAIGYFFMVLFWPQVHDNIFLLPFKIALEGMSFDFGAPFSLFNGGVFKGTELTKNYILINLFYKMPEFFVLSFFIFVLLIQKINKDKKRNVNFFYYKISFILLIVLFPNLLIFFNPWYLYDGVRLFLYLIPFLCIFPAILINFLLNAVEKKVYKFLLLFLVGLKIFYLFNFFSLTPYHYVYLNIFAGQYSENSKMFENDYFGISTKALISKINYSNSIDKETKVKIAVCGIPEDTQFNYLKSLTNLDFVLVNVDEKFDYIIMNNRAIWDSGTQTCFDRYKGKDIITIKRRGLILSKITKI